MVSKISELTKAACKEQQEATAKARQRLANRYGKIMLLQAAAQAEIRNNPDKTSFGGRPIRPRRMVKVPAELLLDLTGTWLDVWGKNDEYD